MAKQHKALTNDKELNQETIKAIIEAQNGNLEGIDNLEEWLDNL